MIMYENGKRNSKGKGTYVNGDHYEEEWKTIKIREKENLFIQMEILMGMLNYSQYILSCDYLLVSSF